MRFCKNDDRQTKARTSAQFGCLVILGTILAAPSAVAQSSNPPIDILNGQTYMKETQDVSFLSAYQFSGNGRAVNNIDIITFDTSNSQFGGGATPSAQQTIAGTDQLTPPNQLPSAPSVAVASGRMYNTANDQFVSMSIANIVNLNKRAPLWSFTYFNPPNPSTTSQQPIYGNVPASSGDNFAWEVMGNFRGDGLSEAVAVYMNSNNGNVSWGMTVLGASTSQGNSPPLNSLELGPELYNSAPLTSSQSFPSTNQTSVGVGDFNGDGKDEIAVLMNDNQTIRFYSVDPNSYAISPMSPATLKLSSPVYRGNLVPGRFVLSNQVDLVALGSSADANGDLTFEYINTQTNGVFDPVQKTPASTPQQPTNTESPYAFFAYASPLIAQPNVFGTEQLVLVSQNASGDQNFWIGDLYVNRYAFTQLSYTNLGDSGCTLGMQPGNFDHQTSSGGYNPAEQVAFLFNKPGCTSGTPAILIDSINVPTGLGPDFGANSWLNQKTTIYPSPVGNQSLGTYYPTVLALDVSDVQGRSQRLGAPEIVLLPQETQPEVVLPMPPMEADYVIPPDPADCATGTGNGTTQPCAAAITFSPTTQNSKIPAFANQFISTQTSNQQTHNTATTSWGLSVKTSVGAKFSFNDLESSDSGSIKDTAQSLFNTTASKQTIKGSAFQTAVTVQTITSDVLFFTQRDLYVYYYPVLGLNDSNNNPIYVEFSLPSNLHHFPASDATQYDWYQPVQEPGNVLSYPWSFTQMEQGFSNPLDVQTQRSGFGCQTVGSEQTSFSTSWKNNSTTNQSVASSSSFSNDLSVSTSAGAGITGIDGASITESIDVAASTSLSSLNVETATLDSGEGVTDNSPGFTNLNGWGYYMAQYIWGEKPPTNNTIWQTINFNTTDPDAPNYYNQATKGPLFVGFIADPVPNRGGGPCSNNSAPPAWGATYTLPDVGLNHSKRWHWSTTSSTISFNYPNGTTQNTPAGQSTSVNPFLAPFYWMKGFFITSQNSNLNGPTLTAANDGDQVQLTARVYNFSLKDTDDPTLQQPASKIYVDFYGQQVCSSNLCPGTLFEIKETVLTQAIPGFKSTRYAGKPNWVLASVPFDTSGRAGQNLVFWVITWMEDANGNRVQEMPGHGLTQIPNENLTNLLDPTQLAMENYSNNVGLYGVHTQFSILPAPPAAGLPGSEPPAKPGTLESLALSGPSKVYLDDDVYIKARLTATGGPVDRVTIDYYHGKPSGEHLIDAQVVHHIDADDSYVHATSFQAMSCGTHKIYAQASTGQGSVTSQDFKFTVTVDPIALINDMLARLPKIKLAGEFGHSLSLNLEAAKSLFEKGQTARGISSLQVFAHAVDAVAGLSGAAPQRSLSALAGEARTIGSCLGGATLAASN